MRSMEMSSQGLEGILFGWRNPEGLGWEGLGSLTYQHMFSHNVEWFLSLTATKSYG